MKRKLFLKLFIMAILGLVILLAPNKVNAEAKINATEVKLYSNSREELEKYKIPIPEDYAQSFEVEFSNTNYIPRYKINGDNINVDENTIFVKSSNNRSETDTVDVTLADQKFTITVNVVDYEEVWVNSIIDKYIEENFTEEMTGKEKVKKICEYIANTYMYDNINSSYISMVLNGGGDCWASTDCIIYMARKLGLKAHSRIANDEYGTGSGHMNAAVLADGIIYTADVGFYSETLPRTYWIEEVENDGLYAFELKSTLAGGQYGIIKWKYEGFEDVVDIGKLYNENIVKIHGPLKEIDHYLFKNTSPKEIIIPESVEKIEKEAFYNQKNLTKINIPKNVSEIGIQAFYGCENLTEINVDPDNQYFCFEDGILYDKNKTKIICCLPSKTGRVIIPKTVETIEKYAFYRCKNIEGLFIPKNVKLIGEKSFAESGIETLTIEDGCEAVIENDAFCASIKYGIKIPKSITQIGDHVFTFSPSSINTCKFYFEEDSAALDYYNKYVKTMAYEIITPNSKKINQAMLVLDDELYYTGNPLKPVKQVLDGDKVLTEGKDYEITYNDNVNVSKYSTGNRFTVKGIGEYSGEVEMKFTINSVPYDFCFTIPEEIEYGTKVNPVITKNPENLTTYFYYYKEENGELISLKNAPTEIGSYVVEGRNGIGNGYLQTRIRARFKIIEAPERPYKLGDVDENGEITVSDAIMVLQHVAKNNILTGNQLLAADVEKVKGAETTSSSITVSDAIKILQYVAKNISSFD